MEWRPDELAYAGPEHLDPAYVAGYDRKAGYEAGLGDVDADLDELAAHGLDRTSTLVDLGAGTGRLALAAARRFGHVVAVDVSPAMQRHLRERAAEEDLAGLECVRAGFLSYEHAGPPADAVCTRNALHQLPDFWKVMALERISGLLRPGGVLRLRDLVFDFAPGDAEEVIGRWLDHGASDPALGYTREDFAEHLRTEFSTFRWLFEPMLTAAGFEIVRAEFRGAVYGAYTCLKR
ncbi:class I SAM-dependent methyltransferase [Actinomadura sp. DC4]|uniref:class I SAM-dependent methyltransferase n=1 Tax=Actinomadura sp. DC4 TaxID=3055069 RepID=UPI0025B02D60|nr:class I SAM-dependent methyltransferase [Actinomadura sp. DC4]MDN3358447.1 class I SAM-dependent methyltransferase [Actinomadura sp. DC4]